MEIIMSLNMEKRFDRLVEEHAQVCLCERKETLSKINELQQLEKKTKSFYSKDINTIQDHFKNLIANDHKILGEINLRLANSLNEIDYAETDYRLEQLEDYLGQLTFSSLFNFCNSDRDTTLNFTKEAIFSLLSEEKVSESRKNNSKQIISKYDDKFKVCGERQLNLLELLDEKLFITLDFVFGGDWNAIDKFCTKAIKMQIPAETPKVHQLCEEDIPF